MARLWFILVLAALVFWVYSVVDCALQPPTRHRGVGKVWWMLIVLLIPVLGGVLWFAVGRVSGRAIAARRAPDDDPEFLRTLRLTDDQDERIRRLEAELAELDAEDDDSAPPTDPAADPRARRRDGDDDRA
ncbi:PLD nuclease N-terminal domain-containing protein [Microbacterium sp. SORGH_AS_0888]|uniref:PLD nuclease N-terminal domain-containing protein n=1 Tax=Microbacterium sp. SORGH_AS_0888 TaxID=3041791 RepID=UPI0027868480|nr:PLD nuclease N-terminal domain-containing protein [Microbacterium sp. SORGH_AS_0888]MDQ1130658.1 cbb3-type cytochrome oxidase subunit 3 [Microbacterium sp. SORGH_AS_0888]